ncbi:SDR family NAD(P)-dependent oxidoreductase [Nocardiopsis sp. EMB25]|uniref:SDR family NAD(P)-dependent oxidoreductase n=1 Tax=Nocardiopsis sp. EMB25 TaxID=2835867 RepID=UPI0022847626|nr:SDR family NAD(P)-dependent oxidoreductase [Nocardiopsis sp. EMB25]MCY9786753.1 SDR family NAD(P)-dependent oxidoreductase [Nocardiopsis sp. EMB25]
MAGKTVLITGASSGLGRHLAHDLATRGAVLLLHGRDRDRLDRVASEVGARAAKVRTYRADLGDLDQVRDVAERVLEDAPTLDVLVNNAAVGGGADPSVRETSRQGHELRLAANHLAPYLLVRELREALAAAGSARVVNVASAGQLPVDFDDPMFTRGYEGVEAYCRSKLAMIMGTFDLAEELRGQGTTVNALHPAHLMDTRMVRQSGFAPAATVDDGVLPTLRLIADSALEGVTGRYFDRFDEARAHAQAYDPKARRDLAALTERLLNGVPGARTGEGAEPERVS